MSILVVKYGGSAAGCEHAFAADISALVAAGERVVVVHGGGHEITATAAELGIQTRFVDGQRYTDEAMIDVVTMVLAGRVNKKMVRLLAAGGCRAAGICGLDAGMLRAERRSGTDGADLGRVGNITYVDTTLLNALLDAGMVPVVAPLGMGNDSTVYNTNADIAAAAIASALRADTLVFMSDIDGVHSASGQTLSHLTPQIAARMIASGEINGGMIPKIESALQALESGSPSIRIVNGKIPGVLGQVMRGADVGTTIIHAQPIVAAA